MITISAEFEAWLADPASTPAFCLAETRRDGTVLRGTSWQRNLTIDGDLYYHTSGAGVTNVEHEASFAVSNAEIKAPYAQITAAHLKAGIYAGATYEFFMVNPADLTMGRLPLMIGPVGGITLDRATYTAELRGLMQALQQPFGRICTPTCPYNTFDADCGLDEADFIVTGTLDWVSADGLTFGDSARTEPGPAGGIAIASITNANPPVVTLVSAHTQPVGAAVVLSDMDGMEALSGAVTIQNPGVNTFEINIDTTNTTDYPPFVSGTMTPMGADSSFFGYGIMRMTSGPNAALGIEREVKVNVPGQWTIQQSFPYPVVGNETYEMTWGDDHTFETCKTKFSNGRRFGGDPYVPGQDSVMQVARRQ